MHEKELRGGGNDIFKGRKEERGKIAVCTLSFEFHFSDYCYVE